MKFGIFFCTLAVFFCLCGCSTGDDKAVYPIGVILPMSGSCAEASKDVVRGMELARDEINGTGGLRGIPVELQVRDANGDKFSFLEEFDLMRNRGVKVFNFGFGKESITKKKVVEKCDDVFVNFMCSYPPITLDMPNCTRIFINGAQEGDIMSTVVKREGEAEAQLVVMNVDDYSGKADADYLGFNLKVEKTKLYRDVFGEGEDRFDIFSTQIMRLYADYVFYVGYGSELPSFVESLSKAGYRKTVVANCGLLERDFTPPKGITFYSIKTLFELGKIDTEKSRRFVAAYKAKYGVAPSWKSAYGYDSIMLLADAAKKARFIPAKMREHFKNLKYDGAVGKIYFDATADSTSELALVKK